MSTTREDIEALARSLCDERWGEGAYDTPGKVNRSYWRREARMMMQCMIDNNCVDVGERP